MCMAISSLCILPHSTCTQLVWMFTILQHACKYFRGSCCNIHCWKCWNHRHSTSETSYHSTQVRLLCLLPLHISLHMVHCRSVVTTFWISFPGRTNITLFGANLTSNELLSSSNLLQLVLCSITLSLCNPAIWVGFRLMFCTVWTLLLCFCPLHRIVDAILEQIGRTLTVEAVMVR